MRNLTIKKGRAPTFRNQKIQQKSHPSILSLTANALIGFQFILAMQNCDLIARMPPINLEAGQRRCSTDFYAV